MQVVRVKLNTAYLASLMQFYYGLTSSSVVASQPLSPFQFLAWPPTAPKKAMDPTDYLIFDEEHPTV